MIQNLFLRESIEAAGRAQDSDFISQASDVLRQRLRCEFMNVWLHYEEIKYHLFKE